MARKYKSQKWKDKRKAVLKRDGFLCRECSRYGKRKDAEHVHHVIPMAEDPELWLSGHNLISLCKECHNKMHDRNTGELTELGRELRLRTWGS